MKKLEFSYVIRFVALLIVLVVLLFLPAGRLDWWDAWVFIGLYSLFILAYGLWSSGNDPAQLAERSHTAANVKKWDQIILWIYTLLLLLMMVMAGLDGGRFHWMPVALSVRLLGWLDLVLAGSWIWWVITANTFLSSHVRIQEERGHQTVTRGPYRFIRHPMYSGIIIFILCIPLVLDSTLASIPSIIIVALFILRTVLEDRTLQNELPGYKEYAQKVRYRLIPGIW